MDHYIILHEAFDFPFYNDEENQLNAEKFATDLNASNIDTLKEIFERFKEGTGLMMRQNIKESDLTCQLKSCRSPCFTYGRTVYLQKKTKPV